MSWRATLLFAWLLCARTTYAQSGDPYTELDDPSGASEPATESSASSDEELSFEPIAGPSVEALSDAELDALGLESAGPRVDTSFHFWGFADFNSSMLIRPAGAAAATQGRYQSFFIGNLNLYLSKNLSESFRTMAEVRLTYLPNGSFVVSPTGIRNEDTSTVDYANGQALTRWGGIFLQRVYLEWTLHPLITVRGGQFLSPFGIWNVDHGSPAYIPVQRPVAIVSRLFPAQQTGLEILGRWGGSNAHTLGYHLTLSNGTGPISEYKDLDRNKAVGGRVYWERFSEKAYLRSGISAYYGRDTYATPTATLVGSTVNLGTKVAEQSDVLALAADLLFRRGGLQLQAEWLTRQRRYTESGRVVQQTVGAPVAAGGLADTFSWAGYVLASYRFSWYGLTPYVQMEAARMELFGAGLPGSRAQFVGLAAGLNISPIDSVVFKVEGAQGRFPQAPAIARANANVLFFQVAWAF